MLKNLIPALFSVLCFSVLLTDVTEAQVPDIDLQLQAGPLLNNAQLIELTNLALDEGGRGERLFSLFLQNGSDQVQRSIYLNVSLSTANRGLLMEAVQRNNLPFNLEPGQSIYVSNIDLASGRLPGILSDIRFGGEITDEGMQLLNRLQGGTTLPADEYILEVALYQGNNSINGGTLITSNSLSFGGSLIEDDFSIFLQSPGDAVGTGARITNPYPEFRWEGQEDQTYRIIVVEEQQRENPETLIQGAKSTAPGRIGQPASLLEFEIMDMIVEGTRLQFPSSGVQPLQSGKVYYWQIFTSFQTTSGEEERASEIWSFTLGSGFDGRSEVVEADEELKTILHALLGPDVYNQLEQRNFDLHSLILEGEEITGELARDHLLRLAEKIRDGEIKLAR